MDDPHSDLAKYNAKRDFSKTSEPEGRVKRGRGRRYLIQKHAAKRLHYDFRLELDGVLKSWAVTRGPSLNPADKRLAVEVEDHPVSYGGFEGSIPQGQYGGGTVMMWDEGTWEPLGDPHEGLEKGDLKFALHGQRLGGTWALVRMKSRPQDRGRHNWLLIKHKDGVSNADDAEAWLETVATSVTTGRTMDDIARGTPPSGREKAQVKKPYLPSGTRQKSRGSAKVRFIAPELATLADAMPRGSRWVHEIKFDGYRIQALIDDDGVRLMTRKGLDWTHKLSPVSDALKRLDVGSAVIDGEIVATEPDGRHRFSTLQAVLGKEKAEAALQYYVFDLLHLDGADLRGLPLIERKTRLRALLDRANLNTSVIYSEHFDSLAVDLQSEVCGLGLEGLISKRGDAPYHSGRGKSWLKVKCHQRQEFVIGGFTEPAHAGYGIGALLLGYYREGGLVYAGKCGTGFSRSTAQDLRARLDTLGRKTSAFDTLPAQVGKAARYVTPTLVCEIEFTEWTADDCLRHPSFQGLRHDKPAREVGRDAAIDTADEETTMITLNPSKGKRSAVAGIPITHPERILFPEDGLTKEEVAHYYMSVRDYILPHIAGRPISMIRCPGGIGEPCFFQRHLSSGKIPHVQNTGIQVNGRDEDYIMIKDCEGLISLTQWGAIEVHPWGCMAADAERPDRMIFDLDPDPEASWADVTEGAAEVRLRMQEFGLTSFLKTTGGKGLHVVVPIRPNFGWDTIKAFTRAVAQSMAHDDPNRYIATASKAQRKQKIFVDYLRNDHTATAVAPYALRARAGAPVAMPVEWDALGPDLKPSRFTLQTVPTFLNNRKRDPWAQMATLDQDIPRRVLEALHINAEAHSR